MDKAKAITEVEELLVQVDSAINYMTKYAEKEELSLYALKHPDGSMVMERLLLTKANALHAWALLN